MTAHQELLDALDEHTPPCRDIALYTADEVVLRDICVTCPVFAECAAYAREARPTAGFWAGRLYRLHGR